MEIIDEEITDVTFEEQLPFALTFSPTNAKLLDFLLINHGVDYSAEQISELADIPERSLHRSFKCLLEQKLILRTKPNQTYRYTANVKSPAVHALITFQELTLLSKFESLKKIHSQNYIKNE